MKPAADAHTRAFCSTQNFRDLGIEGMVNPNHELAANSDIMACFSSSWNTSVKAAVSVACGPELGKAWELAE
jgi:hypothetical protein